jgi:MFS family permease
VKLATDPWPTASRAWGAVAVLLLAYTVSFVDRTILSLLIAPIREAFAISDTRASLLMGFSFAVFYTLLGLPLGRLADRGNRTRLIAVGIVVWSLMTAACGLADGYWTLFAARIGVGVGEAVLSPAAYSLLGDYFPKEKLGRAIAVYSIGVPLGSGIALVIGGVVINAVSELAHGGHPVLGITESWRITFLFVGLPGLVVALAMAMMREPMRRGPGAGASPAEAKLFVFLRARALAIGAHFGGLSLLTFVIYGFMAWVPTFFARTHGLSPADVGVLYGVVTAVTGATGLLLGGTIADRAFRRGVLDAHLRTVRACVLGAAPFLIAAPLVPNAVAAMALLAIGMLLASMHGGVAGAALQVLTPNRLRGQVTAAYFFVANLIGLGIGPSAVALVTDYAYGEDAALRYSLSIVAAFALPCSALVISAGLPAFRRAAAQSD